MPFGTTHVVVTSAQGVVLAEGDVTFAPPAPPPPTEEPAAEDGAALAPTGADPGATAWGVALTLVGFGAVAVGRARARRAAALAAARRDSA